MNGVRIYEKKILGEYDNKQKFLACHQSLLAAPAPPTVAWIRGIKGGGQPGGGGGVAALLGAAASGRAVAAPFLVINAGLRAAETSVLRCD